VVTGPEERAEKAWMLVAEIREGGGAEAAYLLLDLVKDLCPPGIEWGFEVARLPGVSYIAEGGRLVALSILRGEFGPFMDSRVREVDVRGIPRNALEGLVADPESFLATLQQHLRRWLASAPPDHPLRGDIEAFVEALSRRRKV